MKDLLEGLKHLIIRIVSIQNLICLAKSNNNTYDTGSQNKTVYIFILLNKLYIFTFIFIFQLQYLC